MLVAQGLLTGDQLGELLRGQQATGAGPRKRLGSLVVDGGLATEMEVAQALAEALALPMIDLGRTMAQPEAVRLLPRPAPSGPAC